MTSILRFFAGAFEGFTVTQATKFTLHALSPLYRILDEGGEFASVEVTDEIREFFLWILTGLEFNLSINQVT